MADETVSTPPEPASLRDALTQAFKEAEESKAPQENAAPAEPAPETAGGDGDAPETEDTAPPQPDSKEPPADWSDKDKEDFKSLDAKGQEFLLRRHSEMTADYTKKTTQNAEARKFHEELSPVLKDYESQFKFHGVSPAQGIQLLLQAQAALDQDPVHAIKVIMDGYKIDPKSILPASERDDKVVDPEVEDLKKQVKELTGRLNQTQRAAVNSQETDAARRIESFRAEKDSAGAPKYPHFERLQEPMAKLLKSGLAVDLPSAYDKAVRADDELYSQTLKDREAAAIKARDEDARKKAEAARRLGGTNIKGKNTPQPSTESKSLREELERQFANQVN